MLPKGEDTGVQLELGDIDGDGTNDFVLLSSEKAGASGGLRATVIVRFTPPGGDISHSSERRIEVPIPPQAGKSPSAQLFIADVDGDGFDDAVVFFGGPHAGRARVIRGSKGALRVEADSVGFSPKDDVSGADFFSVGDVNGDGRDDVLFVGLPSAGFMQAFDLFGGAKNGLEPRPFASYTIFAGQRVPAKR